MTFVLDHRLEQSSFFIADWPLCRVALRNDSTYPWLYLVPRLNNVREIYNLNTKDQAALIQEIADAASALNAIYQPEKINTAALGNMVPQLHIHIFARFKNDPAWPKPVWAVQTDEIPYTESAKELELTKLKEFFARTRAGDKAV